MNIVEIQEAAQMLYAAHGDRAEYEAAQKARMKKETGNIDQARDWQRIREAIAQMRGPHAS